MTSPKNHYAFRAADNSLAPSELLSGLLWPPTLSCSPWALQCSREGPVSHLGCGLATEGGV